MKKITKNKRLIDQSEKKLNFKNWVIQHNPEEKWDFNDPDKLCHQLVSTIKVSGSLDIKTVYEIMFANDDSGLTFEQNEKFLNNEY